MLRLCVYEDAQEEKKCAGMPLLNVDKQGVCYNDEGSLLFVLNAGQTRVTKALFGKDSKQRRGRCLYL